MHDLPHYCLCLYVTSGFWWFLWLDLVSINVNTFYQFFFSILLKTDCYFHILASVLSRSMKIGQILSVSICVRKIIKVFLWFQGKVASGNSFFCILSILSKYPMWLKPFADFHIFTFFFIFYFFILFYFIYLFFLLRRFLGRRKVAWAESCRYLSVSQSLSKYS